MPQNSIHVFLLTKVSYYQYLKNISAVVDFIKVYKKVQTLPIFSWVPHIIKGYNKGCMNMDDNKGNDFGRRLTVISNERAKNETEQMGFNSQEYANMQEFFNNEVKKNDAKEVLKTI